MICVFLDSLTTRSDTAVHNCHAIRQFLVVHQVPVALPGRMQTLLVAIGTGALILGGAMGALVALGASGFFSTTLGPLDWRNVFGSFFLAGFNHVLLLY